MNTSLFFIGLLIGGSVAAIGGLIEYFLHLRRRREPRFGVPGCLVYTVGGLLLAGIVALITSFILVRSIVPALVIGAGVLLGFYSGFILLVGVWFLTEDRRSKSAGVDNGLSSDHTVS